MNLSKMQHRRTAYFVNSMVISWLLFVLFVEQILASRLEGTMSEEDENKLRQNGMDIFSNQPCLVFVSLLALQSQVDTFCSLNLLLMKIEAVVIWFI